MHCDGTSDGKKLTGGIPVKCETSHAFYGTSDKTPVHDVVKMEPDSELTREDSEASNKQTSAQTIQNWRIIYISFFTNPSMVNFPATFQLNTKHSPGKQESTFSSVQ